MNERSETEVRRETTIEATPAEVWEALTEEERLAEWLAADVELELVEGGEGRFVFEDGARPARVERLVEEQCLTFTWERPGVGPSRVELTIEGVPGGTRLVVVESDLSGAPTAAATADWWIAKLGALRATLALVPA